MTGIDINLRKSKRMIIDWDKIFWREQVFIYTVTSILILSKKSTGDRPSS